MKRFRDLLIFALCILLALAPAVSANSGPTYWEGSTASGMIVTGEDCPIEVVHEELTFDLPVLPREHYHDEREFSEYTSTVTAEYTFRNPTEHDVTVELLFPFGTEPMYVPGNGMDPDRYTITADGQPVDVTLRHSLVLGEFDMAADSARLREGYAEHPFYSPDMPVTKYTCSIEGADWSDHQFLEARVRLDSDPNRTKYILDPTNSYQTKEDHILVGASLMEGDTAALYVIGEPLEGPLTWDVLSKGETVEGTVDMVQEAQLTLEELLLSGRPEESGVWDVDWYNAAIEMMDRIEAGQGFLDAGSYMELMGWYQYELTIPAGETLVNTVKAPIYPAVHSGWAPAINNYVYLLSPARGWASFGTLHININTEFYMTECNLEGFEETETGYRLELDSLPDKELYFTICTNPHPAKPGSNNTALLAFIAAAIVLVIFAVKRRKKKNR